MSEKPLSADLSVCQLFGYYHPVFSGAAIRHNRLAGELALRGARVFVLTPKWKNTRSRENVNGVTVNRISTTPFGPRWLQFSIFGLLAPLYILRHRHEFQILHSFDQSVFYMPTLIMAKWLGKRVIVERTLMGPLVGAPSSRGRLRRRLLPVWDGYVGNSRRLVEQMVASGAPSGRVMLLPSSVNSDLYRPATSVGRQGLRQARGYDRGDVVICSVGTVMPRKGTDILVNAFMALSEHRPRYHLLLVGSLDENNFRDDLLRMLERSGLKEQTRFTGRIDDPNRLIEHLQLSDIFAFPSRREGLPNALLEAMSVGLACVSGDMQGLVGEIIEPGRTGVVVESHDPQEWALAIQRLGERPELRSRLGRTARKRIVANFSRKEAVDRQMDFYLNVLHDRAHIPPEPDPGGKVRSA